MLEPPGWTRRGWLTLLAAGAAPAADEAPETDAARFLDNPSWRRTAIDRRGDLSYFIDDDAPALGGRPGDPELARWALEAWDRVVAGLLCFYPAEASAALVRVYWGQTGERLGRMQAIPVGGMRGAEVYVDPRPQTFSPALEALCADDPLMRDAVVYRTLLHEIGHALGLVHTTGLEDALYFGGDVTGYYRRYLEGIQMRDDLRRKPGFSETDVGRIRGKYRRPLKP